MARRLAPFAVLFVLALVAFTLKRGPPPNPAKLDSGSPALTVLTYNLDVADPADPATLQALRASDADVVFLQETSAAWEQAVRAAVGDRYRYIEFQPHPSAGGLGILSRYPFKSVERVPGRWFPAWIVELQTPLGPVQAMDVHLRPPLTGFGPLRGYWSNRAFRERELQQFTSHLRPDEPTLVVGDFNEHASRAVRWLESRGFHDALAEFPVSQDTWHWHLPLGTVHGTLDHVMPRGLVPVDARVRETGGSDHFPLRVVLQRRS